MKNTKNNLELTIKKTDVGVMVFDDSNMNRIDVFPYTKEGRKRFDAFMKSLGCENPSEYWD